MEQRLPLALLSNLISTGSLVIMAAGLGEIVRHPEHTVEEPWGWIAAGGLFFYLLNTVVSGAQLPGNRRWILIRGLPAAGFVAVVAAFATQLPVPVFAWLLTLPLVWITLYRMVWRRRQTTPADLVS